jgi:hypothetical protein
LGIFFNFYLCREREYIADRAYLHKRIMRTIA